MFNRHVCISSLSSLLLTCTPSQTVTPHPLSRPRASATHETPKFRLSLCGEAPLRLQGPPDARQSRGCVATFLQPLTDLQTRAWLGVSQLVRRYLVYAPARLAHPAPVVFVFPGSTANAEAAAFYYTHTRFEELADRDGFIVVYGNGVPEAHSSDGQKPMPKGGFLPACRVSHAGEGYDVTYVRTILAQLETELSVDHTRIYATGLSQGGGMALQLVLEAPDLVAAVAPVATVPFQPSGEWLHSCHPQPGLETISMAMLAATGDPMIAYTPGGSAEYPDVHYPGMEETRDAWLTAMKLHGAPEIDHVPDTVTDDSYAPDTGLTSSTIERQRYPVGEAGQEFWYFKAVGMGHWWPNPTQSWSGLWPQLGKTNQDIDFADEAWSFFKRHRKVLSKAATPQHSEAAPSTPLNP